MGKSKRHTKSCREAFPLPSGWVLNEGLDKHWGEWLFLVRAKHSNGFCRNDNKVEKCVLGWCILIRIGTNYISGQHSKTYLIDRCKRGLTVRI